MDRNENGMFAIGNKGGGRPKGSLNKATGELRQVVQDFLDNNIDKLQRDFDLLESKDRIDTIIKLLDFALPKLHRSTIQHTVNKDEITQITRIIIENNE